MSRSRKRSRSRWLLLALLGLAALLALLPEETRLAWRCRIYTGCQPLLALFSGTKSGAGPASASLVFREGSSTAEPEGNPLPLDEEIDRLRAELVRKSDENQRLRALLAVSRSPEDWPGRVAEVIAKQTIWKEPLLGLNQGTQQGVQVGAGVLYRGAVLGRIVAAGTDSSCLALLTHRGIRVAARLAECRMEGVLEGVPDSKGERLARLKVVGRELKARVGEPVVSSGLDGAFPPGCWLGTVVRTERIREVEWELAVRPACEGQHAEAVLVLLGGHLPVPWPQAPLSGRK